MTARPSLHAPLFFREWTTLLPALKRSETSITFILKEALFKEFFMGLEYERARLSRAHSLEGEDRLWSVIETINQGLPESDRFVYARGAESRREELISVLVLLCDYREFLEKSLSPESLQKAHALLEQRGR